MTWDIMSYEVKDLVNILTDKDGKYIGFTVSGKCFDGDGNEQDEENTNMEIIFKDKTQMKKILKLIGEEINE